MTVVRPRPPRLVLWGLLASVALLVIAGAVLVLQLPPGRQAASVLAGLASAGLAVTLLLWWSPGLLDTTPRAVVWRSLFEFGPPYLGYTVMALHWKRLLGAAEAGWLRMAIACLPALLVLWAAVAFARYLRGLDELQQRIELQALASAAALTCAGCAAVGFVGAAGALQVPGEAVIWVFPILLTAYCVVRAALTRRYQ